MTSRELDCPKSGLAKIRLTARRTVAVPSLPKTVELISPAKEKNVHPACPISRSQLVSIEILDEISSPRAKGSVSRCTAFGQECVVVDKNRACVNCVSHQILLSAGSSHAVFASAFSEYRTRAPLFPEA